MIIFFWIDLKELYKKGRAYPWKRPGKCPHCGSYRLWGHGFVLAYFDGFINALILKRYRCPDCGKVFRCRPVVYFPRFQASVDTIPTSISSKAINGKWLRGISGTRRRHWYMALLRHIKAFLGNTWKNGVIRGFDALLSMGIVPVTRCI